jgi:hypothetical protein
MIIVIAGKNVRKLSRGGGQQQAVFGMPGIRVTAGGLSKIQPARDWAAAEKDVDHGK